MLYSVKSQIKGAKVNSIDFTIESATPPDVVSKLATDYIILMLASIYNPSRIEDLSATMKESQQDLFDGNDWYKIFVFKVFINDVEVNGRFVLAPAKQTID